MLIAVAFVALVTFYVAISIALVLLRNAKAHKFYETRSPRLPVLPNPSLIDGHSSWVTQQDKNWKIIDDLHKKLGPNFGYYMCEQAWLSTKDLDLIKLIEVDKGHKHLNRTPLNVPFAKFDRSIFQVEDDDWRRVRRAVGPALTNHKIRTDDVTSEIREMAQKLTTAVERRLEESKLGPRSTMFNANDMFQRLTLSIIFSVTYKKEGLIDFDAEQDSWVKIIDSATRQINDVPVIWALRFPFLRPILSFLVQFQAIGWFYMKIIDFVTAATDINRVAREMHTKVQRKLSLTTGAKEREFSELKRLPNFKRRLGDTLIDAFIDKKIKHDEFIGTALFLLLAGFQTTAETASCLVWHLARNPEIQEKLRTRLKVNGIDDEYVVWCINEAVRWHPAVPLGVGRLLSEDVAIPSNGVIIPKGTFVMPSIWSIHHDPQIWPNHERFDPERWQNSKDFHPAAFMGFGLGPRNCVGGKLAVHVLKLAIEALVTRYKIETCAQTPKEFNFTSPGLIYTIPDEPVRVRLVEIDSVQQQQH